MPECSIIIRAYNEELHIGKLLDGIQKQTIKDIQVILVDSGSTDATVTVAQRYGVEIVKIEPHVFTFGRSLNMGIQQAKANRVVICSAHVFPVFPDWIEKLTAPLVNPKIALTYGKQRGGDTNKFSERQIFETWYPEKSANLQSHPFCNNANAAINRDLWQLHAYNENLPALEDLEWARWAHDQGYQISYIAEAEIIHVHDETWRGVENRYKREAMAFKQIYPYEVFRISDFFHLLLQNVIIDWKQAKKNKILKKTFWQIFLFRWNQFKGTYQGYHQSPNLTWKLKRTFYYPNQNIPSSSDVNKRSIEPIAYHEKKQDE